LGRASAMGGPLVVIAGGRHALIVVEAAQLANIAIVGFLDDDPEASIRVIGMPAPRLGGLREFGALSDHPFHVALGDLPIRRAIIDEMGGVPNAALTVVHPTAFVSPSAQLGAGVYVGAQAVVNARAVVGDHAIVNTSAVVEHDCTIGENTHVAPGAVTGGNVTIGHDSLIGIGSSVIPHTVIGDNVTVGAGAAVVRDVESGRTVRGVPAK